MRSGNDAGCANCFPAEVGRGNVERRGLGRRAIAAGRFALPVEQMAGHCRFTARWGLGQRMDRAGSSSAGLEDLHRVELARSTREEERMSARYGMVIDL